MKAIAKFAPLLLAMFALADAEELPVFTATPTPVFFEPETSISLTEQINLPSVGERVVSPTFTMPDISKLTDNELQEVNLIYAEELINMAVIGQNWDILQELLEIYETMPAFDGILSEYAKGAMLRKQGNQAGAIAKYKSILTKQPDLSYVKLDLALMLTEDKQFKEADRLLSELESANLSPAVLQVITQVRANIKQQERLKPSLSLNYEATDNVNNASAEQVITWLGRQWQKDESSLPQSATGVRYATGLSKESNVGGNHNVVADVGVSGVAYWDNKDYSERTVRAGLGYKFANIDKTFKIVPFFEQNWLGNDPYNQSVGVSSSYGKVVDDKSYMQLNANYANKHYDNDALARRYDGHLLGLGLSLSRRLDNDTLLYGGLDGSLDETKDKELASTRYGVRAGVMQEFDNGMGLNASVRYAKRDFDAPSTLVYNFVRQDKEYQANLSFWHKKLVWLGFRPEANVRYTKIDSNMPAFYSRDNLAYFMSLEKAF